ncbi:MAG: leucine-rich repeat domain-containing protein, partial [Proteobacteria bacterium]|nr:leucine-rich repeat domain-containing protein [Pseudomonadota bacterium]
MLSTNELTATARSASTGPILPGTWTYSPAAGSSLSVGTNAVVGTFVPTDLNSYSIGTVTNQIVVASSTFAYTNSGTGLTITGYNGTGGAVVIPGTIGTVAVTAIGQNAFQGKTSLTAVYIPEGVTAILDGAFAGCSGMTAINLPNSLTSIGNYAFDGCSSLPSITIPNSVTSIGANAFAWCTSLPSITLPSGLNKILSGTFWTCTNLSSITIPAGVNEIQYNAFLNCSNLASVYFQENTPPTVGAYAFQGIAPGAKGYYPSTATAAWRDITTYNDLTIVHPDTESPV